jgi:ankyrin repeat domain-containing protein 42
MEGHLPCLKFMITESRMASGLLASRNDNGETPKMLAQQFYKDPIVEYINMVEWERDHPEEAESESDDWHL